ncbi:hypothetical protein W911_16885 [Hyphomicrobium nitrativorans NL23]|uniref:Uncharacterized protein n=2 Tax=Hyphomicrobium TaxID=81 RepID=V5SIX5_9HYPH|nr:hypothetical protein W911_16885 [Hyphomicrobium nitrativorans NL23]
MGLGDGSYGVLVSENSQARLKKEGIRLGNPDHNEARVLFTTQQMVDSRLHNVDVFRVLDEFFYRHEPRAVRIWDESMLPGEALTLNLDRIGKLLEMVRKVDGRLADRLLDLIAAVNGHPNGSTYQIPDFEAEHSKALRWLSRNKNEVDKKSKESASTLRLLSGKPVRITHDAKGKTVLTYRESLPNDFAPVLICDASARVRKTYALWEVHRKNLLTLARAAKSYKNLRIHVWDTGGGKSAWSDKKAKLNDLIDGIVQTIKTKPNEEWLIVLHQEDGWNIPDLALEITSLLPDTVRKPSFITWGDHHATNKYVEIKNVILAGTLFFQPSDYEARYRLCAAKPVNVPIGDDDLDDLKLGEYAHVILQALCRGSVRKCAENCCGPMDAYIIASANTQIPKILPDVFPDCEIVRWQPVAQPLSGHVKLAVEAIDEYFAGSTDLNHRLSFSEHRKMLGVSPQMHKNRIRDHFVFQDEMAKRGIVEWGKGARMTHFLKLVF